MDMQENPELSGFAAAAIVLGIIILIIAAAWAVLPP